MVNVALDCCESERRRRVRARRGDARRGDEQPVEDAVARRVARGAWFAPLDRSVMSLWQNAP